MSIMEASCDSQEAERGSFGERRRPWSLPAAGGDFTYVFFQDVTDADNLMSVVAYMLLFGGPTPANPLHFVLTSRPENFRLPKFLGPSSFKFPGVRPMSWETADDEDSQLLAEDSARRVIMFLHRHYQIGADLKQACELIRVYDGGWPEQPSNLGHSLHARDYLFDRQDLVTSDKDDLGKLISGADYNKLQAKFNGVVGVDEDGRLTETSETAAQSNARRAEIRDMIGSAQQSFENAAGCSALRPIDDLVEWLDTDKQQRPVIAFVMAALTGFSKLFQHPKGSELMYSRLRKVFGQLFAWDNLAPHIWSISADAKNIFKNQFNVDCDTRSLARCFKHWCKCTELDTFFVIPTEVTKGRHEQEKLYAAIHDALLNKSDDERTPMEQLYGLWNAAKQNQPQPIFDPAVVFLTHTLKMKGWDVCAKLLMDAHDISIKVLVGSSFEWDRDVFAIQKRRPEADGHFLQCVEHDDAPMMSGPESARNSDLDCPLPTNSTGTKTKIIAAQGVINFEHYKRYMQEMMDSVSIPDPSDPRLQRQSSLAEMSSRTPPRCISSP